MEIAELLIKQGANINEDKNGIIPLYIAVKAGQIKMSQLLLQHGANVHLFTDEIDVAEKNTNYKDGRMLLLSHLRFIMAMKN